MAPIKVHFQPLPPERTLLNDARRYGSGELLNDVLAPFAFFVLLRWAERQERQEQAIGLFDQQDYAPLLPPRLTWSELTALDPARLIEVVRNELLPTLEHLEGSTVAEMVRSAARAFNPKNLTDRLLYKTLRLVAEQPFETPEDLQAVGSLIRRIVRITVEETRYAGEFITPGRIATLMLEIANPQPGESLYDPCFGMGSLLEGAARRITQAALKLSRGAHQKTQTNSIYGVEKAAVPYLVGLTRMLLAGVQKPGLSHGDALEHYHYSPDKRYDVILSAPPVGGRASDLALHGHFPIRATSIENLFMQHIMASLRPNGRAVVALPEGFLFRGGADEQVRHKLLSEFCVNGVISLPVGSFLPFTSVKANLIVFRKGNPQDTIWFQEARPTSLRSSNRAVLFDVRTEAQRFASRRQDEMAWLTPRSEVIKRGCELTVKRRLADELNAFIKNVREHDQQLHVVPLEQIAEVISGIGYTRREASDEPMPDSVPLIRVSELGKDGKLKPAKLHLNGVFTGLIPNMAKRLIQSGDILLSTRGTIGKVGRVGVEDVGGIAAHGITTIRLENEKVQPLYLMRLLQSGPYQQWLATHASGTTIMNLSVSELGQLPVPVPAIDVQRAIATTAKAGADTTELLKSIVSGRSVNDFLSFLFRDPTINDLVAKRVSEVDEIDQIARLSAALRPWRNRAAHQIATGDPALSPWLLKAASLAELLRDTLELPSGAQRLAAFGIMQSELDELDVLANVHNDEAVKTRLRLIKDAMKETILKSCYRVLDETRVSVSLDSDVVNANEKAELVLRFINRGELPLRKVRIHTAPDHSEVTTNILSAGEELVWTVNLSAQPAGTHALSVGWKAQRLDNVSVEDDILVIYTATNKAVAETFDFGTNPYIVGNPLTSSDAQEMFFGREDVIDQIRRSLRRSGPSTVLLVEGNRRAGKTSILYRLQKPGMLPGWITVYWSAQRAQGDKSAPGLDDKEIFYNISREIVLAVHSAGYPVDAPGIGIVGTETSQPELRKLLRTVMRPAFETSGQFELLDVLVESVSSMTNQHRVLLILDEFDKIQEGIDNGVTSAQVPENLRALFHGHEHLSGILTGARRIKRLRENHWSALYGIGVSISVDALDVEAARRLVTEPVKNRLLYTSTASQRVLQLTARQPYLMQALCYRVFEECASRNERSVAISIVEAAADKMLVDSEHFRTVFDYIGKERPRYLTCVVNRLSEAGERATFDRVAEELETDRVEYDETALADDLRMLQELDVLSLEQSESGSYYTIKIPLFSRWLNKHEHDRMHRQLAAQE